MITLGLVASASMMLAEEPGFIDKEIKKIKEAPAQERVELMNAFKLKLAQMNQQERTEALEKLRAQIRVQTNKQTDTEGKELTKRLQERNEVMQMDEVKQMEQVQKMQQEQMGNQFAKDQQGNMQQVPMDTVTQKPSSTATPQH